TSSHIVGIEKGLQVNKMLAPASLHAKNQERSEKREKAMASDQRGPWSHHRSSGLATLLFLVALLGVLSACGPGATRTSRTPSTPVQTIHTIYFTGQHTGQDASVDALQSENGSLRWHKQLGKPW